MFGSQMANESAQHSVHPLKPFVERFPLDLSEVLKSPGDLELSIQFT